MNAIRGLLARRDFRRLLGAQVTSLAADGLYQIAVAAVLIFGASADSTPWQAAKVLAVTLLPFSVIGPFTGPFIDRFSRRSILVGSSVLRIGLTLLLIPALAGPEWVLLSLVVANMSINRFFHSTKSAVLPLLVPRDRYLLANTVSSVAGMVFGLLGAVVGGPLADLVSEEAVIASGAALMTLTAAFAWLLHLPPGTRRGLAGLAGELRDNAKEVAEGVRMLRGSREAMYAIWSVWTVRGVLGFLFLAGIVLLRSRFDLQTSGASALLGAIGVGGFLGAVALPRVTARIGEARVPPLAFAFAGAAILALGWIPLWPAVLASVFVGGIAMVAIKITSDTMVQHAVPDHFRGRAFAVYDIGYNGVFVLAAIIPAALEPAIGDVGIVLAAGAASVLAAGAFSRLRRRVADPAAAPGAGRSEPRPAP